MADSLTEEQGRKADLFLARVKSVMDEVFPGDKSHAGDLLLGVAVKCFMPAMTRAMAHEHLSECLRKFGKDLVS